MNKERSKEVKERKTNKGHLHILLLPFFFVNFDHTFHILLFFYLFYFFFVTYFFFTFPFNFVHIKKRFDFAFIIYVGLKISKNNVWAELLVFYLYFLFYSSIKKWESAKLRFFGTFINWNFTKPTTFPLICFLSVKLWGRFKKEIKIINHLKSSLERINFWKEES